MSCDEVTRAAIAAAWTAQHQYGGALLGEHLGEGLAVAWSATVSAVILHSRVAARWLGWTGLVASGLYLLNQGDILRTAGGDFPVWELAGLVGSTAWAAWVIALGITLWRSRAPRTPRST